MRARYGGVLLTVPVPANARTCIQGPCTAFLYQTTDVHSCQLVPMLPQRASTMTSQCSSSTTVQQVLTSIHDGQLALVPTGIHDDQCVPFSARRASQSRSMITCNGQRTPTISQWAPMTFNSSLCIQSNWFGAHAINTREQAWYLVLMICKPLASQSITKLPYCLWYNIKIYQILRFWGKSPKGLLNVRGNALKKLNSYHRVPQRPSLHVAASCVNCILSLYRRVRDIWR